MFVQNDNLKFPYSGIARKKQVKYTENILKYLFSSSPGVGTTVEFKNQSTNPDENDIRKLLYDFLFGVQQ